VLTPGLIPPGPLTMPIYLGPVGLTLGQTAGYPARPEGTMLSLSISVYDRTADQLVCRLLIGLLGNGNGGTLVSGSRLPDSGRFAAPTGWRKNMYRMVTASLFLVASTAFCSAQELFVRRRS
jgi:hypothetical protein